DETSASVPRCNERSPIGSRKPLRNISGEAIPAMPPLGKMDLASGPNAFCISIQVHCSKPKAWPPMPMTAPNKPRSALKSGCDATSAAAKTIKRAVVAENSKKKATPVKCGLSSPIDGRRDHSYGPPPSNPPLQLGAVISDHWPCP